MSLEVTPGQKFRKKKQKNQILILLHGRQKTDQNILVFGKSCFSGDKIAYFSIIWKNLILF